MQVQDIMTSARATDKCSMRVTNINVKVSENKYITCKSTGGWNKQIKEHGISPMELWEVRKSHKAPGAQQMKQQNGNLVEKVECARHFVVAKYLCRILLMEWDELL